MNTARTLLLVSILPLASCTTDRPEQATDDVHQASGPVVLMATLSPTEGSSASGTVRFERGPGRSVLVTVVVAGLEQGSRHGIHVHEFGDCSAPDGSSAGGHFNPAGSPHGAPSSPANLRHMGDLGNFVVSADGVAQFEATDDVIELEGASGIQGRAVIVHAGEDDFTTQPTGNAGTRLACGVIVREGLEGD